MNTSLRTLIANNNLGFADIIEAYAMMCVDTARDITEDMIRDEGIVGLISAGTDLSQQGIIDHAVEWAVSNAPAMLADEVDSSFVRKDGESDLHYVLRAAVEKYAKDTGAFQIKLS